MTNKGMTAINEALTVVEKIPTTYSTSEESVPVSTIMLLEFVLKMVNHAVDNRAAIIKIARQGENAVPASHSDDTIITAYVGNTCLRHAEILTKLVLMPPGYPIERLVKVLSVELASIQKQATEKGLGPL